MPLSFHANPQHLMIPPPRRRMLPDIVPLEQLGSIVDPRQHRGGQRRIGLLHLTQRSQCSRGVVPTHRTGEQHGKHPDR